MTSLPRGLRETRIGVETRQLILTVLVMTLLMGLALSLIATVTDRPVGVPFLTAWGKRFAATYVTVLPVVLLVLPIARWMARRLDLMMFDGGRGPSE